MNLRELGFTQEELQKRVIDQLCDEMMAGECEWVDFDSFRKNLNTRIKDGIDSSIERLAEEHVLPNVSKQIEEACLQQTDRWGKATGESVTFIEYLVQRAEEYLTEKVDVLGHSKAESERSYEWNGKQSRVTNLVDRYLHHSIEKAMKEAIEVANNIIAKDIEEAMKLKLAEVVKSLKVSATVSG